MRPLLSIVAGAFTIFGGMRQDDFVLPKLSDSPRFRPTSSPHTEDRAFTKGKRHFSQKSRANRRKAKKRH